MLRKIGVVLGLLICSAAIANAEQTIIVGDHVLLPNTAGQIVQIFVSSNTQVAGLDMNAQVADSGPLALGSIVGPGIVGDIITGTIFASNNTGVGDGDGGAFGNQVEFLSTTTASGTVLANGLLVTLTVDTTGLDSNSPGDLGPGHWSLRLFDTVNGPTDFADPLINASNVIVDGSLIIPSPEPTSIVLGLFAIAGLGAVAVRNRRRA
jgi:hypothetical protein